MTMIEQTTEHDAQRMVAYAMVVKGRLLDELGRDDDAMAAFEEALAVVGDSTTPELQPAVAFALHGKASLLRGAGRDDEAATVLAQLLTTYAADPPPRTAGELADARVMAAALLAEARESAASLLRFASWLPHREDPTAVGIRDTIARAVAGKAATLATLGHAADAVAVCDELISSLDTAPTPGLRPVRALALTDRGRWLQAAGRTPDAIEAYSLVLSDFTPGESIEIDGRLQSARDALRSLS
jgi:tetratricopeptide (TPR) repeat protein